MPTDFTPLQALALSNCAQEPVHCPNSIQPFGALIATDAQLETITHISDNLASVLGKSDQWQNADVLGQALHTVLPSELIHDLCNACGLPNICHQRERLGIQTIHQQPLNVSVHSNGRYRIIELERLRSSQEQVSASMLQVKSILDSLPDSREMLSAAVKILRHYTGFDRVMAYQFLQDGSGEVVAEAHAYDLVPYLGLRYPASDIPTQVRELALKTTLRVIENTQYTAVPILATDRCEAPLDLSLSFLRSVSPVHLEYLDNMGIQATMNISIITGGKLWGLFSFHHTQPKLLSSDTCVMMELFGQLFSLKFKQVLAEEKFRDRRRAASTLDSIVRQQRPDNDWQATITQVHPQLCQLLSAHGVAFIKGEEIVSIHGDVPDERAILALVSHSQLQPEETITLESLSQLKLPAVKNWGKSAGTLLFALQTTQPLYLAFFRNESIHEIRWGGNPAKKDITHSRFGPRLRPRVSFEEYKETVIGRCQPWSCQELVIALEMRTELVRLVDNRVYNFQQRQQNLLVAELNHRVKNILALIRSIARQTRTSTSSLTEYAQMLEQRIAALASAHELVAGHGLAWPGLKSLLAVELRPYRVNQQPRIQLIGKEVGLKANFVPTFVLVLHELASNAAKYGALSVPQGQLSVRWFETDGGLSFLWQESQGPTVSTPKRRGFGRELIERAIPYEFEGEAMLQFDPYGVKAEFWLPSDLVRWQVEAAPKAQGDLRDELSIEQSKPQNLGRVLVVEDNMLLAMEMENTLKQLGYEAIDAAPNVARARQYLKNNRYHICVLDIDLKNETSFAIAHTLIQQNIPFAFTTGYDSKHAVPETLKAIPLIQKPIQLAELKEAFQRLIDFQA